MPPEARQKRGGALLSIFIRLSLTSAALAGEISERAAVIPATGSLSVNELKSVVIEIRAEMRAHGYLLATQRAVRQAAAPLSSPPAEEELRTVARQLGADILLWPRLRRLDTGAYYLVIAGISSAADSPVAVRARLPSRGAGVYTRRQIKPAIAACIAEIVHASPNPIYGPFPKVETVDPASLLSKEGRDDSESSKASRREDENAPARPAGRTDTPDDDSEKKDWSRWDHAGIFGELGFVFSWCRGDALCSGASQGYGGRIRAGVRIISIISISVTGVGVDHHMPITTDTEVFLNVKNAFVAAGILGGLRIHPVRRFFVDPFVGIDLGWLWLLHASNETIEVPVGLPDGLSEEVAELASTRRTALSLQGFTVAPEIGLNFFVAPVLAFGVHVQWTIPFWRDACARVYDPTTGGMSSASKVCVDPDKVKTSTTMPSSVADLLSKEDNLPKFIALELSLTFVFR
jgi:hypothetical protein